MKPSREADEETIRSALNLEMAGFGRSPVRLASSGTSYWYVSVFRSLLVRMRCEKANRSVPWILFDV